MLKRTAQVLGFPSNFGNDCRRVPAHQSFYELASVVMVLKSLTTIFETGIYLRVFTTHPIQTVEYGIQSKWNSQDTKRPPFQNYAF